MSQQELKHVSRSLLTCFFECPPKGFAYRRFLISEEQFTNPQSLSWMRSTFMIESPRRWQEQTFVSTDYQTGGVPLNGQPGRGFRRRPRH